jgi:hypothetical protein
MHKVQEALINVSKPTFAQTWMIFVEKNCVISVGQVDGFFAVCRSKLGSHGSCKHLRH